LVILTLNIFFKPKIEAISEKKLNYHSNMEQNL
jgi:hypothetical protein